MKDDVSVSIMDLLSLLFKKIKLLILFLLIGAVLAWAVTSFLITPKYTSSVNMYVDNGYTDAMIQSGTPLINTTAQAASKELVNTYSVLLTDRSFLVEVAEALEQNVSLVGLRNAIKIQSVNDTVVMNVSVTTPDAQLSADICNTIARLAPGMLKEVVRAGTTSVMGEAIPATAPSSPNVLRNTVLGALGGLALAAGLIIMIELIDTTIRDDEKIKTHFDVAFLGSVPSQAPNGMGKGKKVNRGQLYPKMKIGEKTSFKVTESYKTIRTNLMFTMGTSGNKAIEITSSNPSECKSVTSANLAITMAMTGARVLLIDADMRRPVQHKIFALDNSRGLSSVLAGLSELNTCVKQNVVPNLDVFPSGPIPPNPSELISSGNMKVLLDALNEYYDVILIDTPPIGVVTDALALSANTNGILLLARQGTTKTGDLANSISNIRSVGANLLGVILADVNLKNMSYSYKNKYSTYQHDSYGYDYDDK